MKSVTIVADGSSLGNGRDSARAAAAALLGYKGVWRAVAQYLGNSTNQQAEIAAAAIALESLNEPCEVLLMSDSRYVVETMGGTWKRKSNHEWWSRLDKAAARHRIEWRWLKGHAGHEVQEAVDKLARKTAQLGRVDPVLLDETAGDIGVTEID